MYPSGTEPIGNIWEGKQIKKETWKLTTRLAVAFCVSFSFVWWFLMVAFSSHFLLLSQVNGQHLVIHY